jgi:hypothetical protein
MVRGELGIMSNGYYKNNLGKASWNIPPTHCYTQHYHQLVQAQTVGGAADQYSHCSEAMGFLSILDTYNFFEC